MNRLGYTLFGFAVGLFFGLMMGGNAYGWDAGFQALFGYAIVFALLAAMFGFIVDACRWPLDKVKDDLIKQGPDPAHPEMKVKHFVPPLRPSYPPMAKTTSVVRELEAEYAYITGAGRVSPEENAELNRHIVDYVQERIKECEGTDQHALKQYWQNELKLLKGERHYG